MHLAQQPLLACSQASKVRKARITAFLLHVLRRAISVELYNRKKEWAWKVGESNEWREGGDRATLESKAGAPDETTVH